MRLAHAMRRISAIACLPLSAMGRGMAAAAYALSTFLYHAEFADLPPDIHTFTRNVATSVGTGVPARLLTGAPALGGFGLLPLLAHTRARHAATASRLLYHLLAPTRPLPAPPPPTAPQPHSWVTRLLRTLFPLPPSWASHVLNAWIPRSGPHVWGYTVFRAVFRRIRPSTPSPQPVLAPSHPHHSPPWTTLAAILLRHACPSLHPAQTLLCASLSRPTDVAQGILGLPSLHQPYRLPPGTLTHMAVALQAVGPLLPSPTAHHASTHHILVTPHHATPSSPPSAPASLATLHWPNPSSRPSHPLPPLTPAATAISVRTYTSLLTTDIVDHRAKLHSEFVGMALSTSARTTAPAAVANFRAALAAAWRLPCDNAIKETLWRLAINCIPGSRAHPWHCPCGFQAPRSVSSRQHSFWDCPVAVAVRDQLATAMGSPPTRASLWLLRPTPAGLCPGSWTLVCLAALDAMDFGRRYLWAGHRSHRTDAVPQPAAVVAVGNAAAARFWHNLQDFTAAHAAPPPSWPVSPGHPFLYLRDGRLALRLPAHAPAAGHARSPGPGDDAAAASGVPGF
jgi:hypothetical protein